MKNEIYEKLKTAQALFQSQLDEVIKGFPELTGAYAKVGVQLYEVPISSMPKENKTVSKKDLLWYSYNEDDYFLPFMYSKNRKVKIVFDDEPESSNQP